MMHYFSGEFSLLVTVIPTPFAKLIALILLFLICFGLIVALVGLIRKSINNQIDEQLEKMIPFKNLRERITVKIKWR